MHTRVRVRAGRVNRISGAVYPITLMANSVYKLEGQTVLPMRHVRMGLAGEVARFSDFQ